MRPSPGVAYGALTRSGAASQPLRLPRLPRPWSCPQSRPTTPLGPKAHRFGLRPFRSPLLRASQNAASLPATLHVLISLPRGTEMFQFPRCPACGLCIPPPLPTLARRRVAPFGSDRLIARLQLPGHVSPLSASFFGTRPLGIPPSPLSAWHARSFTTGARRASRTSKRETSLRPLGRTITHDLGTRLGESKVGKIEVFLFSCEGSTRALL